MLDERRIRAAESSLRGMLKVDSFEGMSFLDIGSGSGLFSLAARRLSARVHSFDADPQSVACTEELRRRYFPADPSWSVEEGSALDSAYVESLGRFDIVYSWGVLHHTGDMWKAFDNIWKVVGAGGTLFIGIYNDAGSQSARWLQIKRTYNRLPRFLRPAFALIAVAPQEAKSALRHVFTLRFLQDLRTWSGYDRNRGMSRWHDIVDWVGGYPYEVATPDRILDFFRVRGFELTSIRAGNVGLGCNQFVFVKSGNA